MKKNDSEAYVAYPPIEIYNENDVISYILASDYHPNAPDDFILNVYGGEYPTQLFFDRAFVYIQNHFSVGLYIGLTFCHGKEIVGDISINLDGLRENKKQMESLTLIKLIRTLESCKLIEYRGETIDDLFNS